MPGNCGKYFAQILVFRIFLQVVQNTLRVFQKLVDKSFRKCLDISGPFSDDFGKHRLPSYDVLGCISNTLEVVHWLGVNQT